MSKSYEVTGEIHNLGETQSYGDNGFTKREFVIKKTGEDENPEYPNYIGLELIKDKCSIMDGYTVGQEIKVMFNLGGRLWAGNGKGEKCFNALQAWKVEALSGTVTPTPHTKAPELQVDTGEDLIPF